MAQTTYTGEELPKITVDTERYINCCALDLLGIKVNLMKETLESLGIPFDRFSQELLLEEHREVEGDVIVENKQTLKKVQKARNNAIYKIPKNAKRVSLRDIYFYENKFPELKGNPGYFENDEFIKYHIIANDFNDANIAVRNIKFDNWLVDGVSETEPSHVGLDYAIIYKYGINPGAFELPPEVLEYVRQAYQDGFIPESSLPHSGDTLRRGCEMYKLFFFAMKDDIPEYALMALMGNFFVECSWNVNVYNKEEFAGGGANGTGGMINCGEGLFGLTGWESKREYINAIGGELNPVITEANYIAGGNNTPSKPKENKDKNGKQDKQNKNTQNTGSSERGGTGSTTQIIKDKARRQAEKIKKKVKKVETKITQTAAEIAEAYRNNGKKQIKRKPRNPDSESLYFDTTIDEADETKIPSTTFMGIPGIGHGPYLYQCDAKSWGKILDYYIMHKLADKHANNLKQVTDKARTCYSSYLFKASPAFDPTLDEVKKSVDAYKKQHAKMYNTTHVKDGFAVAMYVACMLAEYMTNAYLTDDPDAYSKVPDMTYYQKKQ